MRLVLQRVSWARVKVSGDIVGEIENGLLALIGVAQGDTEQDADYLANKTAYLRIFEDDAGKMNLSIKDVGGSMLVVSQFTLHADTRKGRRPAFVNAMEPGEAERLCKRFASQVEAEKVPVQSGLFGAKMAVELCNQGPVTIIIDSTDKRK